MSKVFMTVVLLLLLVMALVACGGEEKETTTQAKPGDAFGEKYPGYYRQVKNGIITITNYNPENLKNLPSYQEMIAYGEGAGMENEGVVYDISINDTKIDPQKEEAYYHAELDGNNQDVLLEEGAYFRTEEEKRQIIDKLLEMMAYAKSLE